MLPCILCSAHEQRHVQGLLPIKTHRTDTRRSLKESDFEVAGSPIPVRNETDIFQVRLWRVMASWRIAGAMSVYHALQHLLLSGNPLSGHPRTGCRQLDSTMYRPSCGFLVPKLRFDGAMISLEILCSMSADKCIDVAWVPTESLVHRMAAHK